MSSPSKVKKKPFQATYSDETKALFFEKYKELKGNVSAAAKVAGCSPEAARYWLRKVRPDSDLETWEVIRRGRGSIEQKIDTLIFKMLASMEKKVPKATLRDAAEAVKVLATMQAAMQRPPRPGASLDPIGPSSDEEEAMAILEKARRRVNGQIENGVPTEES